MTETVLGQTQKVLIESARYAILTKIFKKVSEGLISAHGEYAMSVFCQIKTRRIMVDFKKEDYIIHPLKKLFKDSNKKIGYLLYKQIIRNENVAIYEISIDYKKFLIGYEVFLINKIKSKKAKEIHIFEKYPKSPDTEFDKKGNIRPDDFGKTAFSYDNLELAKKKYDQLCFLSNKKEGE